MKGEVWGHVAWPIAWGKGAGVALIQGSIAPAAAWRAPRLDLWLAAEQPRLFLWSPVVYGFGVAAYFAWPEEPALAGPAAIAVAAFVVMWIARGAGATPSVLVAALVIIATGGLAAKLRTAWVAGPILATPLTNVAVRGHLEVVEPRPGAGQRLTILVTAIEGLAVPEMPRRVRVRTATADRDLKPGDAVIIKATLSPPGAPALPGDYDFGRAAFFSGLGAVGYSAGQAVRDPFPGARTWQLEIEAAIGRVRQAISRRITTALPGENGAIADALISGERGGISQATNDAYRASGLYHVLSISGLHMTVMAGSVFIAVRFLLSLIPALALRWPIKKWAAGAATLAAFGYLLLSGASFATVRSWVMITIMFLAVLLDRPALALRNVALAALAIMLIMPESIFDAGFQMSFAAVVALIAAYEEIARRRTRAVNHTRGILRQMAGFVGGILVSTAIATAAVAPFAIYHFHATQWYSALANLVALPVCDLVVMPAALATLVALPFGLEWWPLRVMDVGISIMNWTAVTVAALPGAVTRVPSIPQSAFVVMVLGGLWLALWQTRVRWGGVALIAAGVALAPFADRPDVLIGRGGKLVAVRDVDGRLQALADRGGAYELQRWLEHEGDTRAPRDVAKGTAFRCDAVGCTAAAAGRPIAVAQHPAALIDDCSRAALIVQQMARASACRGPALVLDANRLMSEGTHAVRFKPDGIEILTVSAVRGARPWNPMARAHGAAPSPRDTKTAARFAPPFDLSAPPLPLFPRGDIDAITPGDEP